MSDWTPTDNQKEFLRVTQEYEYTAQVAEVAREVGIRRENWYQWLQNDNFVEWWNQQWTKWFATRLPVVFGKLMQAVRKGNPGHRVVDPQAAKLIIQRFDQGFEPKQRQSVDVKAEHSDAELDRMSQNVLEQLDKEAIRQFPESDE